jgi:S-adenosylmethionine hydrolase
MNHVTTATPVVTLTTDFGSSDGFVGMMKGVILSINSHVAIVDIAHDIAPQNVEQGAFVLAASARYFPANAIHVVVIDPGVGTARRPIAVRVGETIFVAPDNGVLSLAIPNFQHPTSYLQPPIHNLESQISVVHLNNPKYWLPRVSNTFHGRDIFAPCAAHLSLGVPLEAMGAPIRDWVKLPHVLPSRREDGAIVGRVVHTDRFGNIVTNVGEEMLQDVNQERWIVEIAGKRITGIRRAYSDGLPGELIALINSAWLLEIAQREGNAAQALGVRIGDEVVAFS